MKSIKSQKSADLKGDTKLAKLEILVDELIKETPHETRIRTYMKAAGLPYQADPIMRMNSVLEALDGVRNTAAKRIREPEQGI